MDEEHVPLVRSPRGVGSLMALITTGGGHHQPQNPSKGDLGLEESDSLCTQDRGSWDSSCVLGGTFSRPS